MDAQSHFCWISQSLFRGLMPALCFYTNFMLAGARQNIPE